MAKNTKVKDPETGEMVSKSTFYGRQKIKDPDSGEMITKSALHQRKWRKKNLSHLKDAIKSR
jgi:hypothetical protein